MLMLMLLLWTKLQRYCSLSFFCSQHLTALTHFHVSAHRTKTKLRTGSTPTKHGAPAQRISFGIFSCSWQTRFFLLLMTSTELLESKAEEPSPSDGILLLSPKWPKQMIQQWFLSVILPGLGLFLVILSLIILRFQQHTTSKWGDFQRRDHR